MKTLHKNKLFYRCTVLSVALLPRAAYALAQPFLSFFIFTTIVMLTVISAEADSSVDRLVESARKGETSQEQLADSLLTLAEVNHHAVERPEILILRFPGFVDVIGKKAVARVVQHVREDNFDSLNQLSVFADRMLGIQSSYTQEIKRLVLLRSKYESLVSRGTVDSAAAFRAELVTDLEKELFLEKLQSFMGETIERQTDKNAPFRSIQNLMQLGRVSQSQELVDAVKELVRLVVVQAQSSQLNWDESNFQEPQVAKFLQDLQKKDPEFTHLLVSVDEARVLYLTANSQLEEARAAFTRVLANRPDPDPANLELRKQMLFSLSGEEARSFAEELIVPLDRADALTTAEKWRLYSAGYYGRGALAILIAVMLGLLLLSALFLYVLGRMIPGLSPDQIYSRWQENRRQRMIKRNEKRGVGYTSVVEHEDQYSLLLKEFGLEDDATEAEIKKAYRQMVKELHPDAHGASGRVVDESGNTDRSFDELKRNYNRLMEMRNSFFSK